VATLNLSTITIPFLPFFIAGIFIRHRAVAAGELGECVFGFFDITSIGLSFKQRV
jgi:hypothetical protein